MDSDANALMRSQQRHGVCIVIVLLAVVDAAVVAMHLRRLSRLRGVALLAGQRGQIRHRVAIGQSLQQPDQREVFGQVEGRVQPLRRVESAAQRALEQSEGRAAAWTEGEGETKCQLTSSSESSSPATPPCPPLLRCSDNDTDPPFVSRLFWMQLVHQLWPHGSMRGSRLSAAAAPVASLLSSVSLQMSHSATSARAGSIRDMNTAVASDEADAAAD